MLFETKTVSFNHNIFSVSEISSKLKSLVESNFHQVQIRGEISNSKLVASGHFYFSLKDASAVLDAVSWRDKVSRMPVMPTDGMEIICTGRMTTYDARSKYQLIVDRIEFAGQGALLKVLEDRKQKLAEEGLFKQERKKVLPFLPRCIGIITSSTGAVIQDMLHRIQDRFPCPVLLWPVLVQGEGAAEQIANAVHGFNHLPANFPHRQPDLLIIARGGGSLEDLWAFNEEIVVRAIAASQIPVISGVGHEPDITLTDLVADYRAPTPSAAAERAVPVRRDLAERISQNTNRLNRYLERSFDNYTLIFDGLNEMLNQSDKRYFDYQHLRLNGMAQRLRHPLDRVAYSRSFVKSLDHRLQNTISRLMDYQFHRLTQSSTLLHSYSFAATLKRGFTLVKDAHGHLIKSKDLCRVGESIKIVFYDGEIKAEMIQP